MIIGELPRGAKWGARKRDKSRRFVAPQGAIALIMKRRDLSRYSYLCKFRCAMILGFHFIFTAYGFWLPNDPRGSWSQSIRQFRLQRYGPATRVTTTRSLAADPHDERQRLVAKKLLKYPPVRFTGLQARAIANGIANAVRDRGYIVHALAVLPDHVHLVMRHHPLHIDQIAEHIKARATRRLSIVKLHPMQQFASHSGRCPSPWARGHWCPFLRSERHVRAAARYVERNPVKAGFNQQRWRLVVPYGC